MKIIVCDRCGKQIERWEGNKIKIKSYYDGSISTKDFCSDCFKDFETFFYKRGERNE